MDLTPLTRGLLTGVMELDDPDISSAINAMVRDASPEELRLTVCDLVHATVALANLLEQQTGVTADTILTDITSGCVT